MAGFTAPKTSMYLITDQTPAFEVDVFDGIMGMGAQAQGFFASVVKQGLPGTPSLVLSLLPSAHINFRKAVFSLYLTPNNSGKTAELTLGGIDSTKFTGSLTYASLPSSSFGTWELQSSGITVNGRSTSALKKGREFIFDSGTSNILLDTKTTEVSGIVGGLDVADGVGCRRYMR